jgi:AcrR family transcriptional regulator
MFEKKMQRKRKGNIRTYSKDDQLVLNRRQEIVKFATALFVKKGFLKTTTREIADASKMSIGALYHYIGSKEDILSLLCDDGVSRVKSLFEEVDSLPAINSTEKIRIIIRRYLQHVDELQNDIVFWYQESRNMPADSRKALFDLENLLEEMFKRELIEGSKRGEFRISDSTLAANGIVVLCDMWAFRRWFLRKRYTLEKYIEELTEIILNSIGAESRGGERAAEKSL